MKGRERGLLILTVTVICVALIYHFFLAKALEGSFSIAGGALENSRETFRRCVKTIRESGDTRQRYKEIAYSLPEQNPGQDPAETFQNQLYRLLSEQLGARNLNFGNYKYEEIKNVNDYYFVNIEVRISGTYYELIRLLKAMELQGLLIQSFQLKLEGRMQADTINLQVTVARLVKHDDASRQRSKRLGRRRA